MNERDGKKRREWVKNAAIIFLTIMLLLTFFSNTIMNYSLPEVATQYVQSGSITAKVRGTGNVEATDPYNVEVKGSRVIASVAVKQGDPVEKDQVIYYLEDTDSEELAAAEKELDDLELAYMKGLFGSNVSSEIISKVANGNTDGFAALQAKVTDMQNRLDAAEKRVKECQDALNNLSLQSTVNTNNAGVNTIDAENAVAQATSELSNAQADETNVEAAFSRMKAQKIEEINYKITETQNAISDLEKIVSSATGITESVYGVKENQSPSQSDSVQTENTSGGIDVYIQRREAAKQIVDNKLNDIYSAAINQQQADYYTGDKNIDALKAWINQSEDRYKDYEKLLSDYNAAVSQYNIAVELVNDASNQLNIYGDKKSELESKRAELKILQSKLAEINAQTYTPGDSIEEAKAKLDQANKYLLDQTNANKQTSAAYQNQIANAEAALKNAQAVYELLKEEQAEMNSDINAELDLAKASKDIADKKAEIAKLRAESVGTTITAPVAGTVTSLAYKAGETTKPDEAAAVIQMEGKGYTMTISVTNEQAKKVQVGDTAELQNAWYYDDAQVILSAIKPDPDKPGQNKLLEFNVSGSSIQAGQALNVSVGQRSSEYELVVPNSAVREDNNGKFILIVESKSSPLGNRYIATRVDVEVLASDDNNTAISAGLYGYEYVITTSTKPVEAGKQVRLNES